MAKAWLQAHPAHTVGACPPLPPPRHVYAPVEHLSETEAFPLLRVGADKILMVPGIPDKSEDTEWLARPSEVSEALFQATSETSSDLVNSCLSISQHPLTGSTFGSQRSFPSEQENNGENATPNAPDELKSLNDSDNYDNALLSFMSWQMEKDSQQPEGNLADKDQVSASAISDVSDESIDAGRNNSFGSACSQDQYWEQEALQQTEACLASKDQTSFPCENTPPPSEMPYSFLRCMLERGKGAPFTSVNHLKDVCLGAPAAVELRPKMDSFESFEGNEHLQKEFSYFFKQKERRDFLVSSQVHAKAPEIKYIGKVAVPNSHEQVSEAYILSRGLEFSKLEASGGPFSTVKSNLDETSEQLYFQEERTQKAASTFGEKNVDATENVAFEAVIASIESSKQESPIRGIQTDINKPLADDSQEREPPKSDLSPLNYNDENSFMDKLKHPKYQSTPGVFEPAASKPLLHKEDDGGSSLSRDPDLKSPPNAPQNILSKPRSVIPVLKSFPLSEKAYNWVVGLGETQSSSFQYDINNLNLTEKVGSSNIIFAMKVSTSDSWVLQDLKQQTFEEVADSSDYNLEGLQGKAESGIVTSYGDAEYSSLYKTADVHSERLAELQREVDHSNLGISQTFPTPLPSFVPQEPTSESNYPFPRLRMLRISPDTLPTALTAGDTSKGGKVAISQSKLKPDITNTLEDSDIAAHSSLSFEGLSHFAVTPEGHLSEEAPKASAHLGLANQNTGTSPVIPTSYSQREKPNILHQEIPKAPATGTSPVIPTSYSQREKPNILHQDGYRTDQEPAVLAFPGQADQKNGLSTMTPTSYSRREKPGIFYQQVPTGGYLPEEIPKAPAAPTLSNQQKLPTGVSTSYSQSDKPGVFYQHALTGGRLPENIMKTSAAPGTTDQKFDVPVSPPTSYTGPTVFYQQELPKSHLSEETVRGSALPGPAAQNIGITALPSASYSHGEKPHTFYHQAFPESYLNHPAWKVSVAPGSVDQKIGAAVVPSTYSHDVKPGSFPQEELPDRHFTGETQKVSPVLRPAGQKPEVSTVHSSSYSKGMKPGIFYQHPLSDSRPGKEPLDVLAVSGSAEKTHSPTVTFASQPHKETANAFYQQTLSDSHLTEEALPVYVIPGLRDQKTPLPSELPVSYSHRAKNLPEDVIVSTDSGPADKTADIPTVSSSSYQHKKKPTVPYHQELPDRPVPAGTQKASLVSRSVDQKSGTSHPYGEMPSVFYQQELPDSHSTEKSTKTLIPGPADQKTDLPTVPPTSPSHAEKPIFPYQLTLPGSHLPEDAFKASPVSKSSDELSGISTKTSASYSNKERPSISHQQKFPDSRLTEDAQVSGTTRSEDQKTGTTVSVSPTSYSQKVRPGISYQQVLPSHLSEEALQTSATTRPADQSIAMPIVTSTSSSQREKPQIFYQQALPGSHLPGEPLKVSAAPRPPDQNTGAPAVSSSSYLPGEESIIFYQPGLSGNSLSAETFKSPGISGLTDQKTSIPAGPSASGSHPVREKSIIFYQNDLPTSPLTAETLRVAAVPVPTEQKTGTPAGPSGSHPVDGKFIIFLPDGHLPKEASDVLTSPGAVDLKTGEPPVYSNSYFGEKPIVFHHQALSDSQRTEKGHKVSVVSGPADQKTGLPFITSSYSSLELPDRPLTENTGQVSVVPGPTDQKTAIPTVPSASHSYIERPTVSYQLEFPDRSEKALEVLGGAGPTEQKTEIPVVPSIPYYGERPSGSYQQELPDFPEEALQVLGVAGVVSSSPYSKDEMPLIASQQELPDLTKISLKAELPNTDLLDDEKSELPTVTHRSYLHRKKPAVSSGIGPDDQKTPLPTAFHGSYLQKVKPLVFIQKQLPDRDHYEDIPKISTVYESTAELPDRYLTEDALKIDDGVICKPESSVPFRDVNDVSFIKSKKKDIGTQTNLNCRSGVENWEFISSTTIRSPLQEAYSTRVAFDETFRQYEASRSSDSSSDTSITDSREEDGFSESDDGCGSVDSLAAHVRYLLQCESSLNQAKQILKNAEEEECRVRAHAWNLKFNLGHDCGYSISELNEDDRRKVEEIKAKLFGHGRATHVSEGLCSPQGIGCVPEAVCGHIVIESHEKGCFRTLTAEQPRPDSRHCVFQSVEPSDSIRGRRSPSSWRGRHINLSRSIDQSNTHLKVWNSFQLHSHPPFEKLAPDDIKISKGVGMPFHTNMDSHPLGLVEPTFVPAKEMDFPSPESMKQFTTSITFSSHGHSKYISDTSVFKIGVTTESSQDTGPSLGVFKSRIPEEQISPRDLKQKIFSPSSLKRQSHSPVTILAEDSRQRHKLPADCEHSHQKQKPLERSGFKASHSVPSVTSNCSNFKGVHFSGKDTIISPDKLSSTLEVKEKNVTVTPDLPSCIFIEGRELFEQSHSPHTDHQMRKYSSPSCPDIASCIFLEQRELFEQCKAPQVDHDNREDHSFFPKCQDYVVADLPSDFLDQQQCRSPDVDDDMRKEQFPLSQGQGWVVEKIQHMPQSHFSNMINVDAKVSNLISQSAPDHCTADSPPPSNRKALSCVRITLCPKTSSKLDSGTLDERFHSLDTASKTKINSKCNFDLRTIPSRSLEPTSKLLTCKPIAKDQESLGFLGPESPLDLEVTQSSLPDSKTISQDLKTKLPQNSQIVTSRQTQVNKSDLEGYSKPEGTPVSADGSPKQSKALFPSSSTKLSSDAITQITTESPEKTTFSSEIFINVEDHGQEVLGPMAQKPPELASVCSVQQITSSHGKDGQPVLLPYKPSGSSKMYYVPQLKTLPSCLDSRSDTTIESSHSGSNDAIAPDFPAEMLGTRDDDLSTTVNIKHTEGIYSKRAVTKVKKPPQKDNAGSGDTTVQDKETENLPDTESIKQKEEIHVKRTIPQEFCPEKEGSLEIDISESECHSAFENTTHSVFRSAKFYFHHPVHLPHEQDFCHESLGRSVFMKHSWKDFFHHHSEHSCLPPPGPIADKTKMDYTRIKSLSINLNLGENEKMHTLKNQAKDPKGKRQTNDQKKDQKVTPELTTQCTMSLNELWNKFQERQKQQKSPGNCDKKELSLVERLDRLAKLLQNPITHSLQASESTQDDSRGGRGVRGWRTGKRQHQQRGKLQRKQCKSLERGHNTGDFRKSRVLSHCGGKSNKIKIEQVKLDKYILRKQPDFDYASNTSSDSRLSEESELLTDSPNIFSSTNSLMDSDVLTQTDRDVTLNERSSSISTIDTARLIQAFGQERLYVSPRRIKLYSSVANQQRRYLEKRCKYSKSALGTGYPQMTSEHTRRRHIQEANHISSDSISSAGSFLTLDSTLYNGETVHMLNKGVQAGNLEIVTGTKKYTRDVGVTFPTPSSSEARLEEDSDVTSWSEEKNKEKRFFSNYLQNKNLRKIKPNSCEGVSWFVPVESRKSGSKKENLPKIYSPGIAWFEPVTKNKPWREPLREQNWQKQCMSRGRLGGPGGDGGRVPLRPFVRATLQEALQLHRPDFISRSGERVKRLKLLVQERKLQSIFQSEREALFNTVRPLPRRVVLTVQSNTPIGKKEMIQRTKRIYEQLPEVKKKREEEKRKSDYKSYRLRAQHYKSKVTNRLLGRKVPWD
ncbi:hypothetical protein H671_8g19535 [Cricetulus griseus]|uniref:ALMS motif domain-containing protein n=1 Tax=Cricetulus griseus TaxID=10029 RepID=A0A061I219_CRIGR|nr:hypothetical protein H671_8g19535 [Cricetulus griseus]